jgi:hypothetical protein
VDRLLADLLERIGPCADRLGAAAFLGPLGNLAQADQQLAVGRARGVRALCERLVAETYDEVDASSH